MKRHMNRTKIICSLGPKIEEPETIVKLIEAGVNAIRISGAHYPLEKLVELVLRVKEIKSDLNIPLAILVDLPGTKLRVKLFEKEEIEVKESQKIIIATEESVEADLWILYKNLHEYLKPGHPVLIDDGRIRLNVVRNVGKKIECEVMIGGSIKNGHGVNIPETDLPGEVPTKQDREIIEACVNYEIDYFCVSFVKSSREIRNMRKFINSFDENTGILAKIETKKALDDLDQICKESDGIIVARGDLAVETSMEELPVIQKKVIEAAAAFGKPAIVATEILKSMMENPYPSRAEVMDVANAILDGADALLLTAETAVGKYPIETVETMRRIIENVENHVSQIKSSLLQRHLQEVHDDLSQAIAKSSFEIAQEIGAKAIITSTASGSTARRVSYYRPNCLILATTPRERTYHQLSIVWGVVPILMPEILDVDLMIPVAVEKAKQLGYVESSDVVVVTAGMPAGVTGTTNLIKAHVVE
ncbi:pyruvate kinase [Pseudothermotoga thermarum]|uniref:Pyruvate kinase n=1 Tax=Pseudothermotoga thermarum DSM 5069 TaxID=688269 RepID=F7YWE3_9THEM|nr:pyruvate kinase [Pseudothermotoga thermarum]AEH51921.1 pyruvate kinase [Pseudothermotoga thermarum DSM 5069]